MSLRRWMREQMLGESVEDSDGPPGRPLVDSLFRREREQTGGLGEFDSTSYPDELAALLRRREEALRGFLRLDITDPETRIAAIPELRSLLRTYPHPLIYEALIHAYVEADRMDEARGVAFAARQRRRECELSPYPEIRAEIDRLHEWTPADLAALTEAAQRRR